MQHEFAQFEPLLRAVAAQVCAACPPSICVEDLEQSGRIALLIKFRNSRADQRNDSVRYVRAIVRNAMWDAIRGREFNEARHQRDADRIGDVELETVAPGTLIDGDPFVHRACGQLPSRAARVIELRYQHDLDQREVARRMGISRHSVRRAEASGIAALRRQFARVA